MDGATWGWIGGIVGGLAGLAGGIVGTYFSIRNTNGPKERSFMIRAALITWVGGIVFLALLFVLPDPYRWFMWIPYSFLLPMGIIYGNRRQQKIRQEEARENNP